MKTLFLSLFAAMLCAVILCVAAQTPSPSDQAAPATNAPAAEPASDAASNRYEALRQAERQAPAGGANSAGRRPIRTLNPPAQSVAPADAATPPGGTGAPQSPAAPASAITPATPTNNPAANAETPKFEAPASGTPAGAATAPAATNAPAPIVRPARFPGPATAPGAGAAPGRLSPAGNPAVPNPAPNPAAADVTAPAGNPAAAQPGAATAQPGATKEPAEEIVPAGTIDFREVPLKDVLKIYSKLVGRTILQPANLNAANVSLTTANDLTKKEAIQALEAVLGMNGIATVNFGDKFVKVVPNANVNQAGAFVNTNSLDMPADLGPYVTHIVQLRYIKPTEMAPLLQQFASTIGPNSIFPIDGNGMLILRDFSENVRRELELISQVDVAFPAEYTNEVIFIKYALASEVAAALNSLSTGGGATSFGSSPGGAAGRTGGVGSRAGGFGNTTGGFGSGGFGSGINRPGGFGSTYPGQQGLGGTLGTPGAVTTPGATPGSTFQDRLSSIIRRASTSGEIQILGQTKMIADERSNSLLIYASREDMKVIKDIIAKLDVILPQVLIESVILEIDLNHSHDLGVSWLQTKPTTSANLNSLGAVNNGTFLGPGSFIRTGSSNVGTGSLPGGFSYWAHIGDSLEATITAVAADSHAKVRQMPYIQTSHAVPASLFVGESRPYPSGSYGYSYGSFASVQQLNIGVTLTITPLINPEGLVVMDVDQTIENANGSVNITGIGDVPITSRKQAVCKVAVRDRQTIMVGGLIETTRSKSDSGVPILKDIPILGYAFKSTSEKEERSELLILIRPTVLRTPEIAAAAAKSQTKLTGLGVVEDDEGKYQEKQRKKSPGEFEFRSNNPGPVTTNALPVNPDPGPLGPEPLIDK